jgi:Tfp pilus assembly protein PilX
MADPVQPKKVEVDEKVLNEILDTLKDNKETIKKQGEIIDELRDNQKEYELTASQDQIAKIEKLRASGKLVKSVRVNFYENKLVSSWESVADDVYIDTTGKEVSVQETKLSFSDGKTQVVPQIDFARRKTQKSYEVILEGRDRDGNMQYTVMGDGGKEVVIDGRYIN